MRNAHHGSRWRKITGMRVQSEMPVRTPQNSVMHTRQRRGTVTASARTRLVGDGHQTLKAGKCRHDGRYTVRRKSLPSRADAYLCASLTMPEMRVENA